MKLRLDVSPERQNGLTALLHAHGIEIDENAEYVLTEANPRPETLLVRDSVSGSHHILPLEEILYLESFGHLVEVHTPSGVYRSSQRLYQLAALLDPERFLRISNSVIIAKSHVRVISPTLSMKFILTLDGGHRVDVTRTYYYAFKESFGI